MSHLCSSYLLLPVVLVLTGCTANPYPADWSPLLQQAAADCVSLDGSFENFGVWDDGDQVVLADLFFPLKISEPRLYHYERLAVTRLTLAVGVQSALAIQAWVGDDLLFERQIARDEFDCVDGQLVLHNSDWQFGGVPPFLPVLARSSVERRLFRSADGALIMENHEFSAGALAVVPIAFKASYWFRFERSPEILPDSAVVMLPGGVRQQPVSIQVLLPPVDAPDWSGYDQAVACLATARSAGRQSAPVASDLLQGRSTQAFLLQAGDGTLVPHGIVNGNDWHPATHDLRIEKQHRENPATSDRYVICLLNRGYRWDDEQSRLAE